MNKSILPMIIFSILSGIGLFSMILCSPRQRNTDRISDKDLERYYFEYGIPIKDTTGPRSDMELRIHPYSRRLFEYQSLGNLWWPIQSYSKGYGKLMLPKSYWEANDGQGVWEFGAHDRFQNCDTVSHMHFYLTRKKDKLVIDSSYHVWQRTSLNHTIIDYESYDSLPMWIGDSAQGFWDKHHGNETLEDVKRRKGALQHVGYHPSQVWESGRFSGGILGDPDSAPLGAWINLDSIKPSRRQYAIQFSPKREYRSRIFIDATSANTKGVVFKDIDFRVYDTTPGTWIYKNDFLTWAYHEPNPFAENGWRQFVPPVGQDTLCRTYHGKYFWYEEALGIIPGSYDGGAHVHRFNQKYHDSLWRIYHGWEPIVYHEFISIKQEGKWNYSTKWSGSIEPEFAMDYSFAVGGGVSYSSAQIPYKGGCLTVNVATKTPRQYITIK